MSARAATARGARRRARAAGCSPRATASSCRYVFYLIVSGVLSALWRAAAGEHGDVAGYSAVALTWYVFTAEAATCAINVRLIEEVGDEIGGAVAVEMLARCRSSPCGSRPRWGAARPGWRCSSCPARRRLAGRRAAAARGGRVLALPSLVLAVAVEPVPAARPGGCSVLAARHPGDLVPLPEAGLPPRRHAAAARVLPAPCATSPWRCRSWRWPTRRPGSQPAPGALAAARPGRLGGRPRRRAGCGLPRGRRSAPQVVGGRPHQARDPAVARGAFADAAARRSAFWTQIGAMIANDLAWVAFWVIFQEVSSVRGWDVDRVPRCSRCCARRRASSSACSPTAVGSRRWWRTGRSTRC